MSDFSILSNQTYITNELQKPSIKVVMKIEVETYCRYRNQDLDEESCDRVLDVLVLHLQEVLRQLVHELKEKVYFFNL